MPIASGTVTFARFSVEPVESFPADVRRWLSRGLRARGFEPIDRQTEDERAAGFVELDDHEATGFSPGRIFHGEHALLAWRIDTLKVPAAELKAELARWVTAFQDEHGRAPARKEKADRRAALRQAMRAQATPVTKVYDVSWHLAAQQMQIWAASRKVVDEVALAMESSFRIRLHAQVPSVVATRRGVTDAALAPTPELLGMELSARDLAALARPGERGEEVLRGQA